MFNKHDIYTKLLFCSVLANGVFALFTAPSIISGLLSFSTWEETVYWLAALTIIFMGIYGGILVLKKRKLGLVLCFGVYALQLFGVLTASYNLMLFTGVHVAWTIDLGSLFNLKDTYFQFNLVALFIVILSLISLGSVNKGQNRVNCT